MSSPFDPTADLLGLAGAIPCPGWQVLDAARRRGFTGELTCEVAPTTVPAAKVYFDAGQIYLAERASDPSLGARLLDADALTAAQLEQGTMCVGEVAHLGWLFDRVPAVDRHRVQLVIELMTEGTVGWLASQLVAEVVAAPYRHHPSGVRRWSHPADPPGPTGEQLVPPLLTDGAPTDPIPTDLVSIDSAPTVEVPTDPIPTDLVSIDSAPTVRVPEVAASALPDPEPPTESSDDGVDRWDQPSWLDRPPSSDVSPFAVPPVADVPFPAPAPDSISADVVQPPMTTVGSGEHPETADEAPEERAPLRRPAGVDGTDALSPDLEAESIDRFEVIWPSGEVDDNVAISDDALVNEPRCDSGPPVSPAVAPDDLDTVGSSVDFTVDRPISRSVPSAPLPPPGQASDAVALAVRRAVATIETGSLEARRRIVATPLHDDRSRGEQLLDSSPVARLLRWPPTPSVFDQIDDPHLTSCATPVVAVGRPARGN